MAIHTAELMPLLPFEMSQQEFRCIEIRAVCVQRSALCIEADVVFIGAHDMLISGLIVDKSSATLKAAWVCGSINEMLL